MDLVEVLPRLHMFRFRIGQAYLWRDGSDLTLIDAGDIDSAAAIEDAIRTLGPDPAGIRRIVITHGHRDHYGAAQELADRYGAEIIAHARDAPVVRGERPVPEPDLLDWELPLWEHGLTVPEAPPTRVDREVTGGEVLPFGDGARVVHAPGHTAGSIAIHLPLHGVLFTGDAVASVERVMLGVFNVDRAEAAATFRRLAALAPRTVCVGHGDPLTENAAAAMEAAANAV
ncbi:MBL fold metallo-hydrolase [Streptomyces anulatus]|uniref:MBL fold metallo-hydrolase n=1 Tax=Streptomyces TaxID=1883 RepID=UPI00067C46D6|nr:MULTISPECIES: MBL fold metallo-hydrolase [Streptomyces]KND37061.1 metallo-beta-lactamase [Streptomyces europaeiscabiei]MBT1104081.1 MBL fold metallo-hydrolase [Streptomyces sp. Tu10]OKI75274.1 metallo-beta-lactamase [Streptomyces sp. TSRI0395]WSC59750.1 MBL fold metallo-hydrolase [Streptomyces anulatus]WUC90968.1 MBL fold metallo-hydrolase [Streptomyces anulatus]